MTNADARRVLVAGVGNVLQGDDGFGVEVANRLLQRDGLPQNAKVIETGIGGMTLVQELMNGYDALLILDACDRGGATGQLYLLEPVLPDLSGLQPHELRDYFSDTHYATPIRALNLLKHVGELPAIVNIIGCEPSAIDDLQLGLSPAVANAIDGAVAMAVEWVLEHSSVVQTAQR